MLLNLSKKTWTQGLLLQDFEAHAGANEKVGGEWAACCVPQLLLLQVPSLHLYAPGHHHHHAHTHAHCRWCRA
jgi:hypothetical protein